MKIYALNVPSQHPCLNVLARFGETTNVDTWPLDIRDHRKTESLVFARVSDAREFRRLCEECEMHGDFLFVWATPEILKAIANDVTTALVDFVGDSFDEEELMIRLLRLVRVERSGGGGNILGIPEEIAEELTKKQFVILKALFDAGEAGVSKKNIIAKMWPKKTIENPKYSGFNVHLLLLRRKIEPFGLKIEYDQIDLMYKLQASPAIKKKATKRKVSVARTSQLSH